MIFVAGLPVLSFFFGVIATRHFPFDGSLILQDALPLLTEHEPRTIFDALVVLVALIEYVVCGAAANAARSGLVRVGLDH